MKIAIINNLYKPYNKGGAEKACEESIKQLRERGHDCFIITTKPKTKKEENQDPKTYYLNSNYYHLNKKPYLYRFFWQINNIFNFKNSAKLKKILEKEKPDLVVSNNLMGIGLKAFSIIRNLKIKHTHILHDIQLIHPSGLMILGKEKKLNSLPAKIYQSISRQIAESPEKIISPSKWLMQEHLRRGFFENSEKMIRANPKSFPKEKPEKEKKNNKSLLFIGQLEEHKGIIFLIESFKEIKDKNIELRIIGDGSLSEKIRKIKEKDERIKLLGRKNKEEIEKELMNSKALIVPSLCYENSPTVIHEAQSFDLSVIASNIGGIPEITNKGKDLLFKAGNKESLKDKIRRVLK